MVRKSGRVNVMVIAIENNIPVRIFVQMTSIPENSHEIKMKLSELRVQWRRDLLARRKSMPAAERAMADSAIGSALEQALSRVDGILGFYWPIQSEFDARPQIATWLANGGRRRAVLPVVIQRNAPLKFREWTTRTRMRAAGFGTSVPDEGEWLTPEHLVVPLVGYDAAGYRLGYGGGYYDRTLGAMDVRPRCIGVAYAFCELPDIVPQAHDMRMDLILDERGVRPLA